MLVQPLAHMGDPRTWPMAVIIVGLLAVAIAGLVFEHIVVKNGRFVARDLRVPVGVLATFALTTLVAAPAIAQDRETPQGLPDLISDPPQIWFTKDLTLVPGQPMRVLAFDGFVHNIGTGSLEVAGNPQVEGGMKQRVFNGGEWEDVGAPTVRFETDDGHNHFHLIEAVDYALWDEGQTTLLGDGSKVGFCLVDTEQIEDVVEAFYTIDDSNYCGVDSPDLTDLRMGISPGWRDTYDANVTLQWVDVSTVQPGRYWVSAVTDPNDEIVESNEDNNDLVFSRNKWALPGYIARDLGDVSGSMPVELKTDIYGRVGDVSFVIVDPPSNGTLDVPTGAAVLRDEIVYTPDAGFAGTDSFSYFARDVTSFFPIEPSVATVTIDVDAPNETSDETASSRLLDTSIAPLSTTSLMLHDAYRETVILDSATDIYVRWFARDLPPGLVIDERTGQISGAVTLAGEFSSSLIAFDGAESVSLDVEFSVAEQDVPTLQPTNDFSSVGGERTSYLLGKGGGAGNRFEATGLPEGTRLQEKLPLISGAPQVLGTFDVEVRAFDPDGELLDTISFAWTVRPSIVPAFPL